MGRLQASLRIALLALGAASCGSSPRTSEVEAQVFTPSCLFSGCHAGRTAAMSLNLEAPVMAKLVGVTSVEKPSLKLVEAGDPERSFLLDKLLGRDLPTAPAGMSPWVRMPSTGALEEERIELVRAWIAGGAKEE